jgi:hypothetical protein
MYIYQKHWRLRVLKHITINWKRFHLQICAPHSPLGSFAVVPQVGIKFHLMMRWLCSGCRGMPNGPAEVSGTL